MERFEDYFIYALKTLEGETVALFEDLDKAVEFMAYEATLGNYYEIWKRYIGYTPDYEKARGQRLYKFN